MKNDILLIYPQDETTDFLKHIPDFLFERLGERRFIYQRISTETADTETCISYIEHATNDIFIIFLGHGSSRGCMGARNEQQETQLLIEKKNSQVLQGKTVFFLSCRSSEFLETQKLNGIGFGDLTTEWGEVIGRREADTSAYRHPKGNIQEDDIDYANTILVDVVCRSLHEAIIKKMNIQDLYLLLKLRFNRAIFNLIKNNNPTQVRWVANLLLEAKTEMKLFE